MKTNKSKRQRDIKSKLMAAICMLLVSSIMMVSSTYAWFTLSTAPEVTGITTAVGANGNLEMALLPLDGDATKITAGQGDSMMSKTARESNVTWGNLVDLKNGYGLDQIVLYPSELNKLVVEGKPDAVATTGILKTPTYGADGRIDKLDANTLTGVYTDQGGFYQSANGVDAPYGVRGIGTISSMSARELAFRLAMSNGSTAANQAGGAASATLSNNGAALSQIALKHVMATDTEPDEYTTEDVDALLNIVSGLLGGNGKTGALTYIENAMKQYILAASIAPVAADTNFQTIVDAVNQDTVTVYDMADGEILDADGKKVSLTVPADIASSLTKLQGIYTNLDTAETALETLKATAAPYNWTQISTPMATLINVEKVVFLGPDGFLEKDAEGNPIAKDGKPDELTASQIQAGGKDKMTNFGIYALTNNLNMIMRDGSGIFVEVADFTNDYTASFVMPETETPFVTIPADTMDVVMKADTALTDSTIYLAAARSAVGEFKSTTGGTGSSPISDFYGYIIDLAFRTNAANSWLQLQQEAVDRIYSDGTNTNTQGHGANMTFTTADATVFSVASMKNLMNSIKIVFFDPSAEGENEIIGYAKLDGANITSEDATTVTMPLVMCNEKGEALTGDAAIQIMQLNQNEIHQLSVLVYLDGNTVGNDDVSIGSMSMTGSMNLQFSSSATLVAMDYATLKAGDGGALNGGSGDAPAAPTATKIESVTLNGLDSGSAEAYYGTYNGQAGVSATIKGADGQAVTEGTVTINGQPALNVSGAWVAAIADKPESVTVEYTAPTTP